MSDFRVGDVVRCHETDSWVDGKEFIIVRLNVTGHGEYGHLLQGHGGQTIVPPCSLILVSRASEGVDQ